jgi:hypothetical protein
LASILVLRIPEHQSVWGLGQFQGFRSKCHLNFGSSSRASRQLPPAASAVQTTHTDGDKLSVGSKNDLPFHLFLFTILMMIRLEYGNFGSSRSGPDHWSGSATDQPYHMKEVTMQKNGLLIFKVTQTLAKRNHGGKTTSKPAPLPGCKVMHSSCALQYGNVALTG